MPPSAPRPPSCCLLTPESPAGGVCLPPSGYPRHSYSFQIFPRDNFISLEFIQTHLWNELYTTPAAFPTICKAKGSPYSHAGMGTGTLLKAQTRIYVARGCAAFMCLARARIWATKVNML